MAYSITRAGLATHGKASAAWLYEVSGNYFDVLGIEPYLGRFFHSYDEHGPNSSPYIVLSYAFYWRSHFQSDRSVAGRPVLRRNKHSLYDPGRRADTVPRNRIILRPRFLGSARRPGAGRSVLR